MSGGLRTGLIAIFENAIREYREAVRLDPDFAAAYKKLGNAYRSKGGCWFDHAYYPHEKNEGCAREAVSAYTEALRIDPEDCDTLIDRGGVHFSAGQYDLAVADYTEAIRLCSGDPCEIYGRRAKTYKKMGRFDLSAEDYTEQIRLKPNAGLYKARAIIYEAMGRHDLARGDYTKRIKLEPENFRYYADRAEFYARTGRYGPAINDYVKASNRSNPYDIGYIFNSDDGEGKDIYSRMGDLYSAGGKYEWAVREYTTFLLYMEQRGILTEEYLDVPMGEEDVDSETAAEDEFYAADLVLDGEDFEARWARMRHNERCYCASIYVKRGRLYRTLGMEDKAKDDFETALELNPKNKEARVLLGG